MKKYKSSKKIAAEQFEHRQAELVYHVAKRELNFCKLESDDDAIIAAQEHLDAAQADYYAAAEKIKVRYEI